MDEDMVPGAAPLRPLTAVMNGGAPPHWRDLGVLAVYPGAVTIVHGAREGWEGVLNGIPGVEAVRLDAECIAVRVQG